MSTGKIHFKGLNGIRAIAALIVVFAHTGQYVTFFGLPSPAYYKLHWQGYAVTLFFVLSGFLITYLLLEEKSRTNTVSLKNFYLRRILRIWPLYYCVIFITICLYWFFPAANVPQVSAGPLACYLFLLANVAMHLQIVVSPLGVLWSVGVEEQFYALWPVIMKNCSNAVWALLGVIGIYIFVKASVIPLKSEIISSIVNETRIDCMAIGGFGAVIFRNNGHLLRYIYSLPSQIACWLLFAYSTVWGPITFIRGFNHELYAITFIIIILNVSTNPKNIADLERPIFDFFGKISYGLYIYHMIVIFCLAAVTRSFATPTFTCYVLIYLGVFSITTIISCLSYRYFENPFLSLKERFSVVPTRASTIEDSTKNDAAIIGLEMTATTLEDKDLSF